MPPARTREEALGEAEVYARVILAWHATIGVERAPDRMRRSGETWHDSLSGYLQMVEHFKTADLAQPSEQAAIANTQLSGTFEWFYGEEVPLEFWEKYSDTVYPGRPLELHEAARHIRELHTAFGIVVQESAPTTKVPGDEPRSSHGRVVVRVSGRQALLAEARQHYSAYTSDEHVGVGGVSFLLACSMERAEGGFRESGEIVLLTPAILGFVDDTSEPDHFVRKVRAGELRIDSIEGY